MNRLTAFMHTLGTFGADPAPANERPVYPYIVGAPHPRTGGNPQHCKKGPGRRHVQGKANHARRCQRKLRTCKP